ncbi:hypothetical protein HZB04_01925 [Candidatus Wolfebacteria bacterium]|nr:hypothetical protein [Candidatus Wolfebacteria bacterium]
MKTNYKIFFSTIFIFFYFISFNSFVLAQTGCTDKVCKLTNPLEGKTLTNLIEAFSNFLITVGSFILPIMVLYGAYLILTAGDKAEQVTSGKHVILWAVVGFIIILIASGIKFIIGDVLDIKNIP